MKKFNYIIGALVAGAMAFTSCNLNNTPKFNDADAFIAFTKTTMSVTENGESIDVPLLLTSLAGLEGTAVVEIDTAKSTAKEGVHFSLEAANVSFTKEAPNQAVKLNIIDNEVFGGDVKVVLNITSTTGVNLGAVNTCTVTISDDEHPLKPILGNYSAYSYTGRGEYTYTVNLAMDPSDVQLVWINDIEPYFGSYGYIAANGYTSGIISALDKFAETVTLPASASELYIPSIAEMQMVHKNIDVINAALKTAGGITFERDQKDNQKDLYWTTSENESSSGHAAAVNPLTGELHGGVLKGSGIKKVRFIFAF